MRDPDEPGVPLAHYRTHEGCGVRLTCRKCMAATDFDLEVIIERLKARGTGDESTGIRAVAALVRTPCAKCGATTFETTPAFKSRDMSPFRGEVTGTRTD